MECRLEACHVRSKRDLSEPWRVAAHIELRPRQIFRTLHTTTATSPASYTLPTTRQWQTVAVELLAATAAAGSVLVVVVIAAVIEAVDVAVAAQDVEVRRAMRRSGSRSPSLAVW